VELCTPGPLRGEKMEKKKPEGRKSWISLNNNKKEEKLSQLFLRPKGGGAAHIHWHPNPTTSGKKKKKEEGRGWHKRKKKGGGNLSTEKTGVLTEKNYRIFFHHNNEGKKDQFRFKIRGFHGGDQGRVQRKGGKVEFS